MLYEQMEQLIGATPTLLLNRYTAQMGIGSTIAAKIEFFNPAGSVKDRVALAMIEDAECRGILKKGSVIIEPTSGNTGIGLAAVAAARGYEVIITMPETMSIERRKLIAAYGATIVLTEGAKGMRGAIEKAEEIAAERENAFIAGQFENPANPEAHYASTGLELWADLGGKVDAFVAGVGTGGTITGVGRYLKEKNPDIQIIAAEPADSPVLSGGKAGAHPLQGIGAGFVPETLDAKIYDEIITVSGEQAYQTARILAKCEGILCGISSGAALHAATVIASRKEYEGKTIAVLLPDTGDRYLSTPLFE